MTELSKRVHWTRSKCQLFVSIDLNQWIKSPVSGTSYLAFKLSTTRLSFIHFDSYRLIADTSYSTLRRFYSFFFYVQRVNKSAETQENHFNFNLIDWTVDKRRVGSVYCVFSFRFNDERRVHYTHNISVIFSWFREKCIEERNNFGWLIESKVKQFRRGERRKRNIER